jgi:amino acid transporter
VKPLEMDFSEAEYFDEEDRLSTIAAAQSKANSKETWMKRVKYMIFG